MFAKLKKKIAEEEGVDEGELKVSPGGAQRRTPRETPHRPGEGSPDFGKNHVSESEQVRRLEEKLDEYSQLMKEAVRSKERMENTLISHEEATTKKIQEINEQYQLRRSKMADKLASAVKKKEDEMTERLSVVEKENASLQERLQRLKLTGFRKEEEQEDFQGFQVQELAKVKHMLLNSQEILQKSKAELEQTKEHLREKTQANSALSQSVKTLKDEREALENDRDQLQKANEAAEETLSKLEKGVALLKERCTNLTKNKQENESHISSLELRLTKSQEDLDAVRFNEQSLNSQVQKDLDVKDATISRLQEKLQVMEQRSQDNSLSEDDQMAAIKIERDQLEGKLEEARKQLSNLKVSSSEQISGLEKQISHLNAKITEDQEDQAVCQKDLESSTERYQSEMGKLEARIKELEEERESNIQRIKKQSADLVLQKSSSETEILNLQRNHEQSKKVINDQKQHLQEKVASLEAKIIQLETARDFDKSASEHKIGRLQSATEDYLEKEIEHEKQVLQLEEEKEKLQALCESLNSGAYLEHEKAISGELANLRKEREVTEKQQIEERQLRTSLEERLSDSTAERTALQEKLTDTEQNLERTEEEKTRLEERISEQDQKHREQSQEYTSIVSKLTDKQIEIDDLRKEHATALGEIQRSLSEKEGALSVLRENITQREARCKEYEEQVKNLEQKLHVKHSELENHQQGSEEIGQKNEALADNISDLEGQLVEKNKTIKMQQQRLTDLKKTLSRELRVQAASSSSPAHDSSEEAPKANDVQERRAPSPIAPGETSQPAAITANSLNISYVGSANSALDYREINFRYLRHVVFKFMSGTDLECIQLLKAVSVVLEFTQQEQKIIRDTLEWKNSWFKARPQRKNWDVKLSSVSPHIR